MEEKMRNMVLFQKAELVRLKGENVNLRNACLKLIKASKESRKQQQVQREMVASLSGRLQVVNAAYGILLDDLEIDNNI